MEKRRKISIFLASSIEEFKEERDALELFIRNISDRFEERYNVKIMPLRCENVDPAVSNGRKQDEYNELIRESEMCFFLFFTKAGDYTQEEFETALKSFREKGKPKIYTYFKNVHEGDRVEDSVKKFMQKLDVEFSHFYSSFDHIDTIKLRILLNLKIQEMDFISVEFEDGMCLVNGEKTLSVEKVSEFENNIELKRLRKELAETEEKYYKMKAHYDERSGEQEFFHEYVNVASARENLIKVIEELEKSIFNMSMRMCNDEVHGDITQRQREAYKLFSEGDLEGANNVLDFYEIKSEYQRKQAILKQQEKKNAKVYIGELRQKIEILKALANTSDRFSEIEEVYEEAVSVSEEYLVETDVIYHYAKFLYEQNKHKRALKVAERLEKLYAGENIQDLECTISALYNLVGAIMTVFPQMVEKAEEYLLKAIEILEKLAKKNPERYNGNLAISYGNAGLFYNEQGQPKKAEEYYQKAIEMHEKLAKENPERYNGDLATSYNNAGVFYDDQDQPKKAEEYYQKAIEIHEKLAKENPERYNGDLATSYGNIGAFYHQQGKPKKAEGYLLKVIDIDEKLAKENPERYNGDLAISYNNAGVFYDDRGQLKKAEEYHLKAIAIRGKLAKENSERYNGDLAVSYGNAGSFYLKQSQSKKAEEYNLKATGILEDLAKENPERYNGDLATSYTNVGLLYYKQGQLKKAEGYFFKAIEIRENLVKENPERYNGDLATSYNSAVLFYYKRGHTKKAEGYLLKSISILENLAEKNPDKYSEELKNCRQNLDYLRKMQRVLNKKNKKFKKSPRKKK